MDYLAAWMFLALTILLMAGFPGYLYVAGHGPDLRYDRLWLGFF